MPSGDGVIAFDIPQQAADALTKISGKYSHHSEAARAYAEKHFEASKVCSELLE
jgi:hypothetical protein